MPVTPEQIEQFFKEVGNLRDRIITLEVQVKLLDPGTMIAFKAKVIEALKSVDSDLDKLTTNFDKKCEEIVTLSKQVDNIKLKVGLLVAIITIIVNVIIQVALKLF